MPYFDICSNLTDRSFDPCQQVILDALDAQVQRMSITGCDIQSSKRAVELANQYPELSATLGVHPHQCDQWGAKCQEEFSLILKSPNKVRALGEMGLDYFRDFQPKKLQQEVFTSQLHWAAEYQLPVLLHQRDAHQDFLAILSNGRNKLDKVVVHCFTGSKQELLDYIDLDCYIGITGWICDPVRGKHLHDLIHLIPPQRLLLETDCPYLLPKSMPNRPKNRRNEPKFLPYIADYIAQILKVPAEQLSEQVWKNSVQFFDQTAS